MPYVGVSPVGTFGTGQKDRFSGNNSTTAFTMSRSVEILQIDVFVDNVRQEPTEILYCIWYNSYIYWNTSDWFK